MKAFHFIRKYPLSILCILAVWYGCFFFQAPETPLDDVRLIDKWTHLVMYLVTCGAIWWEYLRSHKTVCPIRLTLWAVIAPVCMGGLIEILQAYCTGGRRSGEWLDLAADTLGVILAAGLGLLALFKRTGNPVKSQLSVLWIALSVWFFAGSSGFALEVNRKMGKPSQEELSMTVYAPDPEAEAVVLYCGTNVSYRLRDDGFWIHTHFRKRIKILREGGKSEGNIEIMVYNNENGVRDVLSGLSGHTFNLENGKVVKSKLSADLKNEQRLNQDYVVKKISMPNVVAGSVVEYEYEISSPDYLTIDPWYAQEDIPVFFTEYEITVPEWFTMRTSQTGREHLDYTQEPVNFSGITNGQVLSGSAVKEHFEGRELSRIRETGHIMCLRDYMTKVTKELTNITIVGSFYKSFNQDWSHELGNLMKSNYFGRLCKNNTPPDFKWKKNGSFWPEGFSLKQKVDSLRNLLWSQYSWDESYNLYARNIRNLDKEKSGNSATLNFALMGMLNEAGVDTRPVVMSRRSMGRLPVMPNRKHLNGMVLCATDPADSSCVYFDAASKDYAVGVIPTDFLVRKAFVLNPADKTFRIVNLEDVCKSSLICSLDLTVAADGMMTGKVAVNHRGLEAARFRSDYRQVLDREEYIAKLASAYDVEIADYETENLDNTKDRVSERYRVNRQADAADGRIYVSPFIGYDFTSPFRDETRDLPVEMSSDASVKIDITLHLPDGYEVEEMPKNLNLRFPDDLITARLLYRQEGRTVKISYSFTRKEMFFDVNQYELLRNCYSMIEQGGSEHIVLKKQP